MTSRWKDNVGRSSGVLEKLRRYFGEAEECGETPLFEQLEGRVLLSANPLSEITEQPQNWEYVDNQATYMPLTAGVGATPTALADAPAATGPTINGITANREAVRTLEVVRFTIDATADAGIAKYQLTINGQAVNVILSSGQSSNFTFREAGTYELVATVTDKAGNVSTYVQSLEVAEIPDVKAPVVSTTVTSNSFHNKDVPLRITISDTDSVEINWTAILVDNATGDERVLGSGDRAVSSLLLETLAVAGGAMDGSYTLRVEAVDKGGNATVLTRSFTIDTIPPEAELVYDRAEVGVVTFDIPASDANGVQRRTLTINGKSVTVNAAGRAQYTFTEAGEYTVVAKVTDKTGNATTISQTIVIGENTDHVGPAVEIVSPAANAHFNSRFDIVVNIADAEGEYVSWKVTTVMPNGTSNSTVGTGRVDNQAVRTISSSSKNGTIRIIVEATDGAGNVTVVEREVTWDTTKPTITNNFKEMPDPLTRPFAVTGSVDDAGSPTSLISWKFTITNWETKEVVKTVTGQGNPQGGVFAEINPAEYPYGQYTIAIEAVDLAGNTAVSQTTRYMDAVPPQLLSCTPVLDGRTLRIYVIVSDNSLRQVSAHWTILSSPMEGGRTEFGGAVNINEVHSLGITGLIKGLYTFELYFTDWAGNASTPHYFSVLVS